MRPNGAVYTATDTVYGEFNTCDPATGAPITLAGTPSLRLERVRGGVRSEVTGAGITLRVDEDDTGRHEYDIDLDDANISAQSGDEYRVAINVGTVDGNSAVGLGVGHFYVQSDGLTTQQKADVNAEADTALTDYDAPTKAELDNLFGTVVQDSINDASATATGFTVTTTVGSDTRVGFLRLTSGTLSGESRLVSWQGTTVSVLSDSSMPTALKQFSAAPANGVTFDFRPL